VGGLERPAFGSALPSAATIWTWSGRKALRRVMTSGDWGAFTRSRFKRKN